MALQACVVAAISPARNSATAFSILGLPRLCMARFLEKRESVVGAQFVTYDGTSHCPAPGLPEAPVPAIEKMGLLATANTFFYAVCSVQYIVVAGTFQPRMPSILVSANAARSSAHRIGDFGIGLAALAPLIYESLRSVRSWVALQCVAHANLDSGGTTMLGRFVAFAIAMALPLCAIAAEPNTPNQEVV